jgi:hypothetical protein
MKSLIQWIEVERTTDDCTGQLLRLQGCVTGNYYIDIRRTDDGRWNWDLRDKDDNNTIICSFRYEDLEIAKYDAVRWAFINLFLRLNVPFVNKVSGHMVGRK